MRRIMIVFALLPMVLFSVKIVVLGSMQAVYPDGYPDSFTPYAAIMPGQPSAALDAYECSFPDIGSSDFDCLIIPEDGTISSIVVHFYDHMIQQVAFITDEVYVADLVWRWGYPNSIERQRQYFFVRWGHSVRAFVALADHFDYRLSVFSVSIGQIE